MRKLIAHRGKREPAEGIPTSTGRITDVESDKGHKYLGILQTNENMQSSIKNETKQTYMKRIKHVMKSKLNGRNRILAISS